YFLALNPFHHVPVLVDGNVRLIESLAILDYLRNSTQSLIVYFPLLRRIVPECGWCKW
ncbi:MAG: hypothetical protein F6K09_27495, partial [Merismopedia sp. SIO2A8]|nr:hypothetical protein [Merismopedia sp. SIO2A8]